MNPGEGYKSCFDFQKDGKVFESFPLNSTTTKKNLRKLREHVIGEIPKYHFFRLTTRGNGYEVSENIQSVDVVDSDEEDADEQIVEPEPEPVPVPKKKKVVRRKKVAASAEE